MTSERGQTLNLGDWVLRISQPEGEGPHPVLVLLHGWTGDENVMWVFAARLLKDYVVVAPRGLYAAEEEGYGWHPDGGKGWPAISDFEPAVARLAELLSPAGFSGQGLDEVDLSQLHLAGFSQGAALAYSFALMHAERVGSLVGLAGFMPEGAKELVARQPLQGKQAFVAHGKQDDTVPVDMAREAVRLLERAGALVTYCEDDAGHKLSSKCFRAMEAFLRKVRPDVRS